MPQSTLPRRIPENKIVKKILDHPQLPVLVDKLDAPQINSLIHHIGLEDSQEIMALIRADQLQEVFEIELWKNQSPGQDEILDLEQFMTWLAVWNEMGDTVIVDKLKQLDEEFVARAFVDLLIAVDRTVVGLAEEGENFGAFGVFARRQEFWPTLLDTLNALYIEEPQYLNWILGRCTFVRTILSEDVSEMDTKSLLDDQLKSDREYRRRSQGFVTPVQALNFLNATKKSTQDQLIMQVAYDLDARRYFETRRQKQSGQVAEPSRVPENRALSHENDTASNAKESLKGTKVDPNGLNELESLMDQLGEFEPKTEQRLKIESSQKSPNRIRRELAALSISHPREFDERQNEVLYLSNILMSGTGVQGGRFTDEEAAKAVLATCNLGLECLLDSAPEDEVELLGECLMDEPGLIRVFQIGYKKISEIPQRAVTGIIQALTGRRLERRIQSQPWIRDQISEQFGRSKLHEPVDEATFSHMQKMIRLLSQICDPQSCQVLIPLVDSFPAFPTYLDPMHKADIHVVKSKRYYQTPSEIDQVDRFLNSLETLL